MAVLTENWRRGKRDIETLRMRKGELNQGSRNDILSMHVPMLCLAGSVSNEEEESGTSKVRGSGIGEEKWKMVREYTGIV